MRKLKDFWQRTRLRLARESERLMSSPVQYPLSRSVPPASAASREAWQVELADAVKTIEDLCRRLELEPHELGVSEAAAKDFPCLVPLSYLDRMRPRDPCDPLLRQIVPVREELSPHGAFDPLRESDCHAAPGLLQKYPGRALLITTSACAVHCRYCFRRHYPYHQEPHSWSSWESTWQLLRETPSIEELILSGGDPLMLDDQRWEVLFKQLMTIPWLKRLRVHSRMPIVLPSRVTTRWLDLLISAPWRIVVVVHANHAQELIGECADTLKQMTASGLMVLNQSVLLRGVNDRVEALEALCLRLIDLGVVPYYLHQMDRVRGTLHFEVDEAEGLQLMSALRERLPGYAVPRYVREIPGAAGKSLLF